MIILMEMCIRDRARTELSEATVEQVMDGVFGTITDCLKLSLIHILSRASMGKISSRPNSISIVRITLEKALYAAKELEMCIRDRSRAASARF